MKRRLLEFLRCPDCGSETLDLLPTEPARGSSDEAIVEGEIRCPRCRERFPIIRGIPRMLPTRLRGSLVQFHADFFARHPDLLPAEARPGHADAVARTLRGYSYEHVELRDFVREIERWWKNFLRLIPDAPSRIGGQVGVDFGCGEGRFLYCAHRCGAEVVGMDLSEGVEVARANTADCPRVHIVQGDIYHPPLRSGVFDFAYSLGVLHHLPDPRAGFRQLVPLVKPAGRVWIWVYGLQGMRLWYRLSHLTWLRPIAPRLPRPIQIGLSGLIAALLEVFLWMPCRLLAHLPNGESLVTRIPLGDACRRPFQTKVRSVLDRVLPPETHFHSSEELESWFAAEGVSGVSVVNNEGRGWSASGVVPASKR